MRLVRFLGRLLLGLAVLGALIAAGGYLYLKGTTLPQTTGRLVLKGLLEPVEVTRDAYGVVHIQARNLHDLFFAQGVVHAQDRLWQMEFQRRVGAGRLAEVLGEAALEEDKFLRTWGFYRAAQAAYRNLSPEAKAAVDAYVAGINAYLATNPPLPLEFRLLGYRPEPWQGADVLVWAKMMSFDLSANYEAELRRYRLLARGLTPERIAELMPPYPEDAPTILPPAGLPLPPPGAEQQAAALLELGQARPRFLEASNNWVVSGRRTASGKPLLANDPHLGLGVPSLWYLIHLEAPGYNAIGASLPGTPGVVIGRNARIAWGVTNVGADVQDLYVLEEQDGGYVYQGEVRPYTTREEVIRVKGGGEVRLVVRETVYGPVISDVVDAPGASPLAVRWVSLEAVDGTLEAFLKINQAGSWGEFREALKGYLAPSQNFVYADVDGNIGYIAPGKIPIRRPGHSGAYPVPGTGAWDWQGFIPFDELPQALNPPEGFIVTANNKVTPPTYPYTLTVDWAEPYRATRIRELLTAKPRLTLEDMVRIQLDQYTLLYRAFRPVLELIQPEDEAARRWRARLLAWDGVMRPDAPEATVFAAWYRELARLPAAEVGQPYWNEPRYLLNALKNGDPACAARGLVCLDYATLAFERAVEAVAEDGRVPAWGAVHRARFAHPVLSQTPLKRFTDRQVPFGGDAFTVNVGPYDLATLRMDHGPSYRQVVDLADPEGSRFIHPMGQSGNLLSPHYADLLPRWASGQYLPMRTQGYAVQQRLVLEPR